MISGNRCAEHRHEAGARSAPNVEPERMKGILGRQILVYDLEMKSSGLGESIGVP